MPRPPRFLVSLLLGWVGLAALVWFSGSMWGAWAIECGVGSIAHDLARGLNPLIPLPDYYDGWTTGYLIAGAIGAPLQWLPIRSVYGLKLLAVLYQAAIVGVAWAFLARNVGAVAARVGTTLLVLCPPQLAFYAVHAGDYHYTELLFDLGMACLLAEIVVHGRRGLGWYAALGGVTGLALTNCLGSAPFVATILGLVWVLDTGALRRPAFWAAPVAGLLGVSPVLHKLLLHDPYSQGRGPVGLKLFYVGGADTPEAVWTKLMALPVGYPASLGFADGLHPLVPWQVSWPAGVLYAALTAAAVLFVLWMERRTLVACVRALLPGARFAVPPERVRRAALVTLALFSVVFLCAYLGSNQSLIADHPNRAQLRSNRFLVPLIGLLALNSGVAVQLLIDRLGVRARRAHAAWIPLAALCALSWTGMIDWGGLRSSQGIPFRGHCYDLHGHFASMFLPDVELHLGQPDRWAPVDVCDGFPAEGRASCFRGRVWGVGKRYIRERELFTTPPAQWEPDRKLIRACDALPDDDWRRDCYRQAGWTLNWGILKANHAPPWVLLPQYCDRFPDPKAADWCIEGGGFYLGDHYAFAPRKFDSLVPPAHASARVRERFASGVGYALTHYLELPARAEAICAQYGALDPALLAPCLEGAQAGYAVFRRPWPPWDGWPAR